MFLTPYHRECLGIVKSDPRWQYGEAAKCEKCGSLTLFTAPSMKPLCPWCWSWPEDAQAPARPALPPTGPPLPDCSKFLCKKCLTYEAPKFEWRVAGKKKKVMVLGAFCTKCGQWVLWVYEAFHPYAPTLPFVAEVKAQVLFGDDPAASARG